MNDISTFGRSCEVLSQSGTRHWIDYTQHEVGHVEALPPVARSCSNSYVMQNAGSQMNQTLLQDRSTCVSTRVVKILARLPARLSPLVVGDSSPELPRL